MTLSALSGAMMAHRENARITAALTVRTTQLTLWSVWPALSVNAPAPRDSSSGDAGGRLSRCRCSRVLRGVPPSAVRSTGSVMSELSWSLTHSPCVVVHSVMWFTSCEPSHRRKTLCSYQFALRFPEGGDEGVDVASGSRAGPASEPAGDVAGSHGNPHGRWQACVRYSVASGVDGEVPRRPEPGRPHTTDILKGDRYSHDPSSPRTIQSSLPPRRHHRDRHRPGTRAGEQELLCLGDGGHRPVACRAASCFVGRVETSSPSRPPTYL